MSSRSDDEGHDPFHVGAGHVTASTQKALRVKLQASSILGEKEVWVPRSVIHDDSEIFDALNNGRGELVVMRWFARKEGWETE